MHARHQYNYTTETYIACNEYRITAALKVEKFIIASITASP